MLPSFYFLTSIASGHRIIEQLRDKSHSLQDIGGYILYNDILCFSRVGMSQRRQQKIAEQCTLFQILPITPPSAWLSVRGIRKFSYKKSDGVPRIGQIPHDEMRNSPDEFSLYEWQCKRGPS